MKQQSNETMKQRNNEAQHHLFAFLLCFFAFLIAVVLTVAPYPVLAQANVDVGLTQLEGTGLGTTDIRVTVANIIRTFLGLLGIIAVALMLYGGFLWMTAAGNEERIEKAKKFLINAGIGLAIVLLAFTITSFIIRSLLSASGVGGSDGGDGGGGGGGGGLPADAFIVKGMTPQGKIPIRNVTVRLVFSRNVNVDSLRAKAIVAKQENGAVVEGVWNADGTVATFVPVASCPEPNEDRKCFDADTPFRVEIEGGVTGLKSADPIPKDLLCGIGGASCRWFFETGNLVDTQDPTVTILLPQNNAYVSADALIPFSARATDDAGLSLVEYLVDGRRIEAVPFDAPYPKDKTSTVSWNTQGLLSNSNHKLLARAFDIDGNQKETQIQANIRAKHCFNNVKDDTETGVDCGGDDCAGCAGDGCGTNDDCAGGACIGGKCVDYPTIESFDPVDGAAKTDASPGAFVTIKGKRFEAYEAGKSKVVFVGDVTNAGDDVPAAFPEACDNTTPWTDTRIVIEVPKNAKTGPVQVFGKSGLYDRTDNDRGVKSDFTVNTKIRPGLCTANPNHGEFQTVVQLLGVGFGTKTQNDRVEFGRVGSGGTIEWNATEIKGVAVPNLREGETDVVVKAGGEQSNPVPFVVEPSKNAPQILSVDPVSGPVGQYVLIKGSNFGSSIGNVFFGEKQFIPDATFSQVCGNDYWNDTSIIAKVPNFPEDERDRQQPIKIVKSGGQESLPADFLVKKTGSSTPGLCRLNPDNGPKGITVELKGEGFGDTTDKVKFGSEEDVAIPFWSVSTIRAIVPQLTQGPVPVQVVKGGTLSNKALFNYRDCRQSGNTCSQGDECCGDGACRQEGTCVTTPPLCQYTWQFTTGKSTHKPCDTTKDCSGNEVCNQETKTCENPDDLCDTTADCSGEDVCNPETKICTDPDDLCDTTKDCSGNEVCDPRTKTCDDPEDSCTKPEGCAPPECESDEQCGKANVCSGTTKLCVAAIPRVVEHPTCSTGFTQSPSPFKDTLDACRNAVIAVKFNTDMDDASVLKVGNVIMKKCNVGKNFDAGACTTIIPLTPYERPLLEQYSERFQWVYDNKLFDKDAWYDVRLNGDEGGIVGISGKLLDGDGDGNAGGSYTSWHFKMRNDDQPCTVSELKVTPETWTMQRRNEERDYQGLVLGSNCNQLVPDPDARSSARSSDATKAEIVNVTSDFAATVRGLNETVPGNPVNITITMTKASGVVNGSGKLTIAFPALEVIQPFPFCEAACVNAQIGARFSTDLATPLPLPIVFRCADSQCLKQPKIPFRDSPVVIPMRGGRIEGNEMLVFGDLPKIPNTRYRVVFQKENVRSVWGRPLTGLNYDYDEDGLNDSYSWTFKVKNDVSLCQLDSVDVQPERREVALIGDTERYQAVPRASPDSCDPEGQMLRSDTYAWVWTSDPAAVATVTNVNQIPSPSDGRVDPIQTATLQSPGTAAIRATTEGKTGEGSISLRCGYARAGQCPDQKFDKDQHPYWYGVDRETCCGLRPRLDTANVIPANAGTNVCRNVVLTLPFLLSENQKLDQTSVQGNIELRDTTASQTVRGRAFVTKNAAGKTIVTFTPEQPLVKGHAYQWKALGDTYVLPSPRGIRDARGVLMPGNPSGTFTVGDSMCKITRVDVALVPDPGRADDFFSCAGRNDCVGDQDQGRDGNQHTYIGQAKDGTGVPLTAFYQWSSSHERIAVQRQCATVQNCSDTPFCVQTCGRAFACEQGKCVSTDESSVDTQTVSVTPQPENGDADIRVFAEAPKEFPENVRTEIGSATKRVRAEIFLCENPWPNIREFPYTEPETHFSLFYCRDRGEQKKTSDDFPNIPGLTPVSPTDDDVSKGVEKIWTLPIRN